MRNRRSGDCFPGQGKSNADWTQNLLPGSEERLLDANGKEEGSGSSDPCVANTRFSAVEDFKLPDDVVERILCMIPFPHLLKVRSLSKTWYSKFPLRSGGTARRLYVNPNLDSDPGGSSSLSFQNLVSFASRKWSIYSPVILGHEGLTGYEAAQKRWQGIFANFQECLGSSIEPGLSSSCGPLICGVSQSSNSCYDVFVINVITGSLRKLPPNPNAKVPSVLHLFFDDSAGYKAFLVTEEPYEGPYDEPGSTNFNRNSTQRQICSQVFDSVEGTWTTSQYVFPSVTSFAWRSCSVHLDKNIYCLSGDDRNPVEHPLQVWVYSLQEGSWTEINHPFGQLVNIHSGLSVLFDLTIFKLIVCGSQIFVVLALDPKQPFEDWSGENTLFIYELDPVSKIITETSRGPPTSVLANCEHVATDGYIIYFCPLDLPACSPVVAYNVKLGEWSRLVLDFKTAGNLTNKRWAEFSLEPGLNPFMVP